MAKLPKTQASLPFALLKAREAVMAPIRAMLADAGITEAQWRVLRVLEEVGPMEPTALAEAASLQAPSLSRIAQGMVERDLVQRAPSQSDRRRQTLALTPGGQAILDAHRPQATALAAQFEATLGSESYAHLLDLLGQLEGLETDLPK